MNEVAKLLKEKYPVKIEMHSHSSGVSKCASVSPEQLVRYYKGEGYDGIVLTNHLYFENAKNEASLRTLIDEIFQEWEKARAEGDRIGIRVYCGVEIRFEKSINDYLLYGADREFFDSLTLENIKSLEAFALVRPRDALFVQAHPFRTGMTLAPESLIDGVEVFNVHKNHHARVGVAAKYAEEMGFLAICGTDYHHTDNGALSALRTKTLPENEKALAAMIKSEDVAWQIGCAMLVF